jgi:hypothetical protein
MAESGTSTRARAARLAAGSGAVLSLGASLVATAGPAGAATFNVTTTADAGAGSLRQAILDANAAPGADTITFQAGLGAIGLTSGELDITDDLVISDPEGDVTVDANGTSRVFYIDNAGAVTITGLTLEGGSGVGNGGAVLSLDTDLTLVASTISNNSATSDGGGVAVVYGTVTVTDTTFVDNTADDYGGGLSVFRAESATVTGSTFTGNTADSDSGGGASFDNVTSVTVADTTFAENTVSITSSTFADNVAENGIGGGLSLEDIATATVAGSTFTGNTTLRQGGGLAAEDVDTLTIDTSTFDGNSTSVGGPAVGGGIAADNVGTATITGSTVSNNASGFGGGIGAIFSGLTVTNSTVSGNQAAAVGGGIAFYGREGDVAITHSTITGNEAGYEGGGVFLGGYGGEAVLDHDIIDGNIVSGGGQPQPGAAEPTFDDVGGAIFVQGPRRGQNEQGVEPQELDSVTLTNNLVNGTIAGVVVDGGGNLFELPANLGPLADNGGPTQTHDLLAGSAALDAGDAAFAPPPSTDQRGLPRVSNGRVDIGAVEVQVQTPVVPPVVPPAQPVPAEPTFTG